MDSMTANDRVYVAHSVVSQLPGMPEMSRAPAMATTPLADPDGRDEDVLCYIAWGPYALPRTGEA